MESTNHPWKERTSWSEPNLQGIMLQLLIFRDVRVLHVDSFIDMISTSAPPESFSFRPFFFGLRKESLASRVTLKSAKPPEGSATPEPEKEEEDEFVGIFVVSGIFFSSGIPCLWRSLLHLIYVVLQRSLYYQPKQGTRGNFSRLAYILASTLIPFKIGND